ncbi:ABC transporter permease subunit [candidate division KSB3 bacterium]|uniref:ABC transporter permease subunit n=1 Tax=candidate division KSB3 bacterium TaxID=2044937 RepID=A0A9D5Q7G3_9BACT|nr:ABC transporter permease subunit [candidate division KSB3 bacterium]
MRQRHSNLGPWLAILPAFIFLLAITLFPFLYTVFISLHDWYLPSSKTFVGLGNFAEVLTDRDFLPALARTIYFTIGCLALEHGLGLALAIFLGSIKKLRGFLTASFMIPMMLPPVVAALIWKLMFRPTTGVLNYFLEVLHLPPQLWVHGQHSVIPSIILVDVWQWTPFVMLVLLGGLNSIPQELFEVAELDGASMRRQILHLVIPLLKPFFLITLLLRFIYVFTTFDIIMSLSSGGPGRSSATIYFMGYLTSFEFLQMGRGATWNILIFLMVLVISLFLVNKIFKGSKL